ncbi:MAG: pyrroline-5-carboxylate reductase [Paludibacteraceae bacterium]
MKKIAIIGAGNMGGAIANGLIKGNLILAEDITISDVSDKLLDKFRQISSLWSLTTSNKSAVKNADIIIVAVKPWLVENVAAEIKNYIDPKKQIIVSIAAGVDFSQLIEFVGSDVTLFRVIPNTAIEVKESVSTIASLNADDEQIQFVKSIFDELGKTFIVDEQYLNAFMSLSSCGIAYAFRYIRAAMEGGVEMGIYPDVAKEVVVQTLKGAIKLLEENGNHPESEIDKVTTPGGITIKGLNEMEACGFTNAVIKGLLKSKI